MAGFAIALTPELGGRLGAGLMWVERAVGEYQTGNEGIGLSMAGIDG